jgi:hypothetical protein
VTAANVESWGESCASTLIRAVSSARTAAGFAVSILLWHGMKERDAAERKVFLVPLAIL